MEDMLHTFVLILHVIGATIIVGVAFVSVIALLANRSPKTNLPLLKQLWTITPWVIYVQILTGIYMAALDWDALGKSSLFWTKIVLVISDGVLGGKLLSQYLRSDETRLGRVGQTALISLTIFVTASIIGVLLGDHHH